MKTTSFNFYKTQYWHLIRRPPKDHTNERPPPGRRGGPCRPCHTWNLRLRGGQPDVLGPR